ALQLTNFWQDFKRDWTAGRLYIPLEDRDAAGASDADLDAGRLTSEWRTALAVVSDRTRALFRDGRPLCDNVRGRLKWELRITWLGGTAILDKLQRGGFDPFAHRPALGAGDMPEILWRTLTWRQATD
ncbi:MAG: squalene/phytoene synthase family protein, partial [Acidobacteria bacterium]|nr:squalene/phytoene synthase family protein [Acidobacteriota bacterium]